jgi:hypothetical protein
MARIPDWLKHLVGQAPLDDAPPSEETTRVTIVSYIDQNGQQGTMEVPGWVGAMPHFMDARIDFSEVLGQAYVERPYETTRDAPDELTVADLRSLDGMVRMFQEFSGSIQDKAQIRRLVIRRLGSEAGKWQIVSAHVLKQATRH